MKIHKCSAVHYVTVKTHDYFRIINKWRLNRTARRIAIASFLQFYSGFFTSDHTGLVL